MSMYLDPPKEKQYDWNEEYKPGEYPGGFFLRQPDVYLEDPFYYLPDAVNAGFHKFLITMSGAMGSGVEALSFMRANTLHAGVDVKFLLVDRHGASEYSIFSEYHKPLAVYPVWSSATDRLEDLMDLIDRPIGDDPRVYDNTNIPTNLRPVKGQSHKIVIRHNIETRVRGQHNKYKPAMTSAERQVEKDRFAVMMSNLQRGNQNVELIFTGSTRFDVLFGHGFKAVSYKLHGVTDNDIWYPLVTLPNGKAIQHDDVLNPAWADWFALVGWEQGWLDGKDKLAKFALNSLQWASRYFNSVTPFVHNGSSRIKILSPEFWEARTQDFTLPKSRRTMMRNSKLNMNEYDRFACDTCILQTTCKLFRQGSICVVKGSEGVGLAENFGTRNVDKLIGGLVKLVEKQAERLEDSMEAEKDSGEVNPEVTKQFNQLFQNGVKLAKLLDPKLNGGPAVSVNVGVGAGGIAAIQTANPRQVIGSIIAELEASGIPRDKITNEMIQGVLENMGTMGAEIASATVAVGSHVEKYDAPKALPSTPDPKDGVTFDDFFGAGFVNGEVVNG